MAVAKESEGSRNLLPGLGGQPFESGPSVMWAREPPRCREGHRISL